jgi:hypothetical protein
MAMERMARKSAESGEKPAFVKFDIGMPLVKAETPEEKWKITEFFPEQGEIVLRNEAGITETIASNVLNAQLTSENGPWRVAE